MREPGRKRGKERVEKPLTTAPHVPPFSSKSRAQTRTSRDNAVDADELAEKAGRETAGGDVVRAKAALKADEKVFRLLCKGAVDARHNVLERLLQWGQNSEGV